MGLFDVYKKEVELETITGKVKYVVKPLKGEFLPKLYSLLSKFNINEGAEDEDILESLDEETVEKLHSLLLETFKSSYPKEKEEELDIFVSQNLMKLFPVLVEVNFNNDIGT